MILAEAKEILKGQLSKCKDSEVEHAIWMSEVKAWESGVWHNMMATFKVHAFEGRIVMPYSHPVLMGIDYKNRPSPIMSNWYEFHENGPGKVECAGDSLPFLEGSFPLFVEPREGDRLGFRSVSCEETGKFLQVSGIDVDGARVYSYENVAGSINRLEGEKVEVSAKELIVTKNLWGRVLSISKDITLNDIEVYIIRRDCDAIFAGIIEAGVRDSLVPRYRINARCDWRQFYVMGKKRQPLKVVDPNGQLLMTSPIALLHLALWYDYTFWRQDVGSGDAYLQRGLAALNDSNKQHTGTARSRIQFEGWRNQGGLKT